MAARGFRCATHEVMLAGWCDDSARDRLASRCSGHCAGCGHRAAPDKEERARPPGRSAPQQGPARQGRPRPGRRPERRRRERALARARPAPASGQGPGGPCPFRCPGASPRLASGGPREFPPRCRPRLLPGTRCPPRWRRSRPRPGRPPRSSGRWPSSTAPRPPASAARRTVPRPNPVTGPARTRARMAPLPWPSRRTRRTRSSGAHPQLMPGLSMAPRQVPAPGPARTGPSVPPTDPTISTRKWCG